MRCGMIVRTGTISGHNNYGGLVIRPAGNVAITLEAICGAQRCLLHGNIRRLLIVSSRPDCYAPPF
jgi:hypothetical protein